MIRLARPLPPPSQPPKSPYSPSRKLRATQVAAGVLFVGVVSVLAAGLFAIAAWLFRLGWLALQ